MQDFARPENYQGSNLMTIKKLAEKIRLENHIIKQHSHISNAKNESGTKEEKLQKGFSNHGDIQMKRSQIRDFKNKKLNYQKLLLSNKPTKVKRESLLIDSDLTKLNENKVVPLETISNVVPSIAKSQNAPTTRFLFGMIFSKKTEAAIKSKAIGRFRWATKMIRAWLRYLNHIIQVTHQQQQQYLYSIETLNETSEFSKNDSDGLKFNKHHFKASKEIELTPEMKKILTFNPKQRTEEQILTIMYGLSALSAFNEYPIHLKKKLCKVAYFRKVDPRRVIIRQGHVAEYFYFIISGTAIVTITSNDDYGQVRTVNSLTKGCSFGELALLHHSRRTASVVSTSAMQLLAIERNDFFYIFMHMSSDFSIYPEHIVFLKDIPVFRHLDFDQLIAQPEACLCHFYKNLIVIQSNDIESEWIYVVKSGSCTVLKELQVPIESKMIRENTLTLSDINSKIQCFDDYHFLPMPINNCDGNIKSQTRYLWRSPTMLKPGDYFYLKNESHNETLHNNVENNRNYASVFIKVADLVPKDIYGLSSVIFSPEDKVRTENMASVALVSNRAEMVLISKKFIIQKADDDLIKDIRQGLTQYPSEKVFLDNYKIRIQWEKYKIQRYNSTLKKLN